VATHLGHEPRPVSVRACAERHSFDHGPGDPEEVGLDIEERGQFIGERPKIIQEHRHVVVRVGPRIAPRGYWTLIQEPSPAATVGVGAMKGLRATA